jgi:hypothetical protein
VSAWAAGHQRDSKRRPPRDCSHLRPQLAGATASATRESPATLRTDDRPGLPRDLDVAGNHDV